MQRKQQRHTWIAALAIGSITSTALACDINVPTDHTSIQAAIDAANAGDTICVDPGTYPESPNFSSAEPNLTLNGPNAGIPGWDSGSRGPEAIIQGTVTISTSNAQTGIVVDGFRIEAGSGSGVANVRLTSGGIFNNVMRGDWVSGNSPSNSGIFTASSSPVVPQTWTLSGNDIDGFRFGLQPDGNSLLVSATITNNVVRNCQRGVQSQTGLHSGTPDIVFSGNTFADNEQGIRLAGGHTTITGNIINNNSVFGIRPGFTGNPLDNLVIENNEITNNGTGLLFDSLPASSDNLVIRCNVIEGNTTGAFSVFALDARFNWWGASDGPSDDGPGSGDSVDGGGLIDFDPWLDSPDCPPFDIVALNADACSSGGAQSLTVDIDMSDMTAEIAGGQFRLEYDTGTLSNPTVTAGDAPFTGFQIIEDDPGQGWLTIAVFSDPPGSTVEATRMASVTFDADEDCTVEDLVTFRPDDPPFFTRLTDDFGNAVFPDLLDLDPVTIDDTNPTITAPSDIVVDADAGFCSAMIDLFNTQVEKFDTNPDLNVWIVDREEPHCFESEFFDGDNRLKHCIHADDAQDSAFHNTQGRKKALDPSVWSMSVDLYVPNNWATTNRRMAGIWAEGHSASFAIIEFTSGSPGFESTSDDAAGAGSPEPRFRAWASGIGWVDMGLPTGFAYDEWHTLTISLVGSEYLYEVGDLTLSLPASGAQEIDWAFLQGYNTHTDYTSGVTYDIHWDNFTTQEMPAVVTDNCDPNPTITATRDDNEPLDAPYPTGTTVITWTATDACGNFSTDTQDVVVSSDNIMVVDVELQSVDPGPFERCVTFELTDASGNVIATVDQTITFTNGEAIGVVVNVPCDDYDCIQARDELHTLRSTGDLVIVGTEYVADGFVPLRGGDLNDDGLVDILDFGVFVSQFGQTVGADTPCGTPGPHADITGSGQVGTGDFNFIQINFFQVDEFCPGSLMAGRLPQPRQHISVRELHRMGLGHLAVADLTGDGWVGPQDIAAFAAGARPE